MKKVILLLFILYSLNTMGQESKEQDTTSIISFNDKIMVKANVDTQIDTYNLMGDPSGIDLKIASNNNYRLFLSLNYQFIGASIGFSPKFFTDNDDDDLKGKSSFRDYQFQFFLGKWIQGLRYRKIQGYYVENTQDFVPDWTEGVDPYLQIPDLKNITWGMSTAYVFNPKFSIRGITHQTEWQRKSTGSFVPALHYNYNRFSFHLYDTESEEDIFETRLVLGYYYTFVFGERFFIATNLSPSLGLDFSKERRSESGNLTVDRNTYVTRFLEGGLQLGYRSKKVILGCSLNFNVNWYNEGAGRVENDQVYGLLYVGFLFDAPDFIEKSNNWIKNKLTK